VNDKFPKTVQANDMEVAINVIARNLRNAYIYQGCRDAARTGRHPEQRKIISDRHRAPGKDHPQRRRQGRAEEGVEARAEYVKDQDTLPRNAQGRQAQGNPGLMQTGDLRKSQTDYLAASRPWWTSRPNSWPRPARKPTPWPMRRSAADDPGRRGRPDDRADRLAHHPQHHHAHAQAGGRRRQDGRR
jgi:hypothetical protein